MVITITINLHNNIFCFSDECILIQNITFKYTICTSIRISFLPGSDVFIMACGMDDSKIRLYVEDELQFNLVETLPGHENWIRDLDFVQYSKRIIYLRYHSS